MAGFDLFSAVGEERVAGAESIVKDSISVFTPSNSGSTEDVSAGGDPNITLDEVRAQLMPAPTLADPTKSASATAVGAGQPTLAPLPGVSPNLLQGGVSGAVGLAGSLFGTLATAIASASQFNKSIDIVKSSGEQQASVFRNAIASVEAQASYNKQVEKKLLGRQLDTLGKQANRLHTTQVAATSTSGFSATSKSFVMVMNESMDQFQDLAVNLMADSTQRQLQIDFESQIQAVDLENRARSSEFATESQIFNLESKKASSLGSIFGTGIKTILGGIKFG